MEGSSIDAVFTAVRLTYRVGAMPIPICAIGSKYRYEPCGAVSSSTIVGDLKHIVGDDRKHAHLPRGQEGQGQGQQRPYNTGNAPIHQRSRKCCKLATSSPMHCIATTVPIHADAGSPGIPRPLTWEYRYELSQVRNCRLGCEVPHACQRPGCLGNPLSSSCVYPSLPLPMGSPVLSY